MIQAICKCLLAYWLTTKPMPISRGSWRNMSTATSSSSCYPLLICFYFSQNSLSVTQITSTSLQTNHFRGSFRVDVPIKSALEVCFCQWGKQREAATGTEASSRENDVNGVWSCSTNKEVTFKLMKLKLSKWVIKRRYQESLLDVCSHGVAIRTMSLRLLMSHPTQKSHEGSSKVQRK